MCFNPHTHEGCDMLKVLSSPPIKTVSIHTPTKGVTCYKSKLTGTGERVSIHTPTKGVTRAVPQLDYSHVGFNPHTHEGCDTNLMISQQR